MIARLKRVLSDEYTRTLVCAAFITGVMLAGTCVTVLAKLAGY